MSVVGGLLGFGRRFGRTQMTATVVIRRQVGTSKDPETGKLTPTREVIYTGPAELLFRDNNARDIDAAGQRFAEQQPLIKLPLDGPEAAAAANVRKDDVGEVTASEFDDGSIGIAFRVTGIFGKSNATSRRLPVEVLSHA